MERTINQITYEIIQELYGHGNPNKAVLASIRSAASMTSPRAQKVWPIMMDKLEKSMLSKNGQPTHAETAIYAALRLYAIHQQSSRDAFVYGSSGRDASADGLTFFQALANLRRNSDTREALDRRVQALFGTTNVNSVINSMTHLIDILKATNPTQNIDYPKLANDLYWFQTSYQDATQTRLKWGQQYYQFIKPTTEGEKK